MKRRVLLAVFTVFSIALLSAQNPIGISDVANYSKLEYSAGAQNWDIKQGSDGVMYFANNEGLLSFDGSYWKIYPVLNHTIVRSLLLMDDKIYVGAQNEIGYFAPDKTGNLTYTSLLSLLPAAERSFADVWRIIPYGKEVFFQTNNKVMRLNDGRFTIYSNEDWKFMGLLNDKIMAQDHNGNLMQFQNGRFIPLMNGTPFTDNFLLTSAVTFCKDTSLVTTLKQGAWLFTNNTLTKLKSAAMDFIASKNIYKCIVLGENRFLLATSLGGSFVVDKKGNLLQRFSLIEGLQNNNVRQAYLDRNRNIWLALDNGIDFVAYDNAVQHIFTDRQNEGGGYAAIVHANTLYLGTSNGLYFTPLDSARNISQSKGPLKPVINTKGQVWNLSTVYGQLLMGHHEGAFQIKKNAAVEINKTSGFWNFFPLPDSSSRTMLCGTYFGVNFFKYGNGTFVRDGVAANFESARIVALANRDIWVAHPYKGIFKVTYDPNHSVVKSYAGKGITSLSHYYIYAVKNRIVAPTEKGFYEYNAAKDAFEPSAFFEKIFGSIRVNYMKEDTEGNIWFTSEKTLGVVDLSGTEPKVIYIAELNSKMVSGFDFIYPINAQNVLIGGEKGFYNIDYTRYRNNVNKIEVLIRKVNAIDAANSAVFGGYYGKDPKSTYTKDNVPQLAYKFNSLRFEYTAALYARQSNVEYSYKLDGFDKHWYGWSKKPEKEYTNLPPGTYTFLVKARTNLGTESAAVSYSFTILPPWYRSLGAYFAYALLMAAGIAYLYKRQKKKFLVQRQQYEKEQERLQYLHQLEMERSEQAIVKLENEKLESEINHKNKELAAATMHLVQKGELLGKIREELSRSLKNKNTEIAVQDFKKVIRMMMEDTKVDEDWSHFVFHFDRVHGDFLMLLKAKYPTLTNYELKLCAYLRMNLSSKEMAQLMNITVRGVELSRYRLRKKLQIPSETNLFDFLIESTKENDLESKNPLARPKATHKIIKPDNESTETP